MSYINDNFVSVTELQKKTKHTLWDINRTRRKIILLNNKPKAVLLSLDEFEELSSKSLNDIPTVIPDEWERKAIAEYEETSQLNEWIDADEFFKELTDEQEHHV